MAFNNFLEAIMKHQPKGILKLKVAHWVLEELRNNNKLTFGELYEKLKEKTDFSPKLLRKVLRILRDLKIIRMTQRNNVWAYEINRYFCDFLRDVDRDFYKKFVSE